MALVSHDAKVKASPRDVFLHFLSMATLYASAISFTAVLFQIINLVVPDVVFGEYYGNGDGAKSILRTAVSFLIVMFPVCLYSLQMLHKTYKESPQKLELTVRKALIYFTLFVVSFIIMFTLVFLTSRLLNGELTMRFFLKLLSTLFVAGAVFGYYRYDLHRGAKAKAPAKK